MDVVNVVELVVYIVIVISVLISFTSCLIGHCIELGGKGGGLQL